MRALSRSGEKSSSRASAAEGKVGRMGGCIGSAEEQSSYFAGDIEPEGNNFLITLEGPSGAPHSRGHHFRPGSIPFRTRRTGSALDIALLAHRGLDRRGAWLP